MGNTALDGRLLGAPDELSRRARLRRFLERVARPPHKVRREARAAYFREWEMNCSLADLPDGAAPALKRHAAALAPTAVPIKLLDEYVEPVTALAALAGVGIGLAVPDAWLASPSGGGEWLQMLAIWLPLSAVAAVITIAPFTGRADRALSDLQKFVLAAGLVCLCVAIVLGLDQWGAPFGLGAVTTYALTAAALAAAARTAGLLLLIVVYVTLAYVLRRIAIARHADSAFVRSLLEALTNLFFLDGRDHGLTFDPRREAVHSLEAAAVAAERYLPRFLDPRDEATATWLRERTAEWASALRAHKRWIITERTRDEKAVDRLRRTLEAAADGEWNRVERRPAYQASRGSRLRTLIATLLRGATPLVAAILLRAFDVPGFDGKIGDYALAAGGVWLALSFLAQYDPLFSAKIGAAADISKTLRGG